MDLIVVKNLVKQFGDFTAVNGINFSVKQGESFGLLGPNGAGKSSTMRIIGATSERTSGEVTILGKDPQKFGPQIRAHLGVVPQQDNLDEELTCAENLYIYGRYFGLPKLTVRNKLDELLEFGQLLDKKNSKVKFEYAVAPERVDPGNQRFGVKNTPRLVGGINQKATDRASAFYSTFCDHVVKVSSPEVAEAAKLLENTFRFVNIGFINDDKPRLLVSSSQVTFKSLTDGEINAYILTNEPMGKAGAYGIQGIGGCLISNISGSYSGIMGLPLFETSLLLNETGVQFSLKP